MEQRFAFDPIATVYKAARPGYPEALVDDVLAYADLKPEDRILEIGCGTGQAPKGFAARGFPILAIDPGPQMLRGARESLAGFANVAFAQTTFEAWPAEPGGFRLIVAAQSWRWVSPALRFAKAAEALSPDGSLAVFGHVPVGLPASMLARFEEIYLRRTGNWGLLRKRATSPVVPSRDGSTNPGCSGRSRTGNTRGDGGTRARALRISCARDRITG